MSAAPTAAVFFLLLLVLFLAVGRSSLFRDPGTLWHTAFGEEVFSGEGIPRVDSNSVTRFGEVWLDLQWLGECAMAAAYRWGGWDTLLLLTACVIAATYAWLAHRFLREGMHGIGVFVILAVFLAASSHHFHARPHLASIGFFGLTVAILLDVESRRRTVMHLAWLVPLFALWANIHGGVLGAAASVAIVVFGWTIQGVRRKESPINSVATFATVALISALAVVAMLATPHGWNAIGTWIRIMRMPLPAVIQEHRPLSLLRVEGVAVLMLAAVYAAALYSMRGRPWRCVWLLPAIWMVLAVMRVRHAPLFAMAAGVALADIIPHTRAAAWLAEHGLWQSKQLGPTRDDARRPETRTSLRFGIVLVLAPIALALPLQTARISVPLLGSRWAQLSPAGWPTELVDDLRRLEAQVERPVRLFNQLHYGGFVIFHTDNTRVFIDDRCELYGGQLLAEYASAEISRPWQFATWHEEFGFDAALVARGSAFDLYLQTLADWRVQAESVTVVLYVPRD